MKRYIYFYVCLFTGAVHSGIFKDSENRSPSQVVDVILFDKTRESSKVVLWGLDSKKPDAHWFFEGREIQADFSPETSANEISQFMKIIEENDL